MRRNSKSKDDVAWLKLLGSRINKAIKDKGYRSPYQFWIEKAGDHMSRTTLKYILNGEKDPKATTLRSIAKLLNIKLSDLFD